MNYLNAGSAIAGRCQVIFIQLSGYNLKAFILKWKKITSKYRLIPRKFNFKTDS